MRTVHLAIVVTILLLFGVPLGFATSGSQVNASITVLCPFNVGLLMLPIYPQTNTITVNYTASATSICTLQNMTGSFWVINQISNAIVYQQSIFAPTTHTALISNSIKFSTQNMVIATSYIAALDLSEGGTYSVYTSNIFQLISYANVSINEFDGSHQFEVGQPLSLQISLQNNGDVASSNIVMYLNLTGPQSYSASYSVPALSPSQSYNSILDIPNATALAGTYSAFITLGYNSLGNPQTVRSGNFIYIVAQPSHGSGTQVQPNPIPLTNPITTLPQVAFTYMPLISSGERGQTTQSQIGLLNSASTPEQVNISIDSAYASVFSLSTKSVYLQPNQSVNIAVYFKSNSSMKTGVYTVPITIDAKYQNGQTARGTEYLTFSVYSQGVDQPTVASQIYLTNASKSASAVISIIAPSGRDISNATLVQWIPLSVVANISDIKVYGLPNNITIENGSYKISSHISNLPRNQTIYEYYSIKSPSNSQLLVRSQYSIYTLSPAKSEDVLRLADISAPTITGNSTADITVSVLYTGTVATHIQMYLVSQPAIVLENNTQNVSVLPNQLIVRTFKIIRHPTNGTYIMQLFIRAPGANLSYGIPIVIVPQSAPASIQSPMITPQLIRYAEYGVAITLIFIAIVIVSVSGGGKQKYSAERAGHLINIREQIKRD